ncbi:MULTISPECIES: zf-HC2 domain-containing protein [unclassified Paenibacillus]|uniref:anti-sigma factor family protein n=1 Tax=unclassified Paenibacillus TaxID=185978 RepID=UPI001AE698BC|nr:MULTISPECIES: zf-HC2 domain-containing protein [unclassified Paenibacillus]MBP1155278.1 hypothetical protein [Paenibacillus sp. PvP091]MBP1169338.1 hypothetical protein [Paenibacillus sp. PvR098]MBP2440366.1 hypothetical protein [Paenibacillus sp. PvP052]
MKCEDIHEWFGVYWDLPEHHLNRQAVDEHIKFCKACEEEFDMWRESTQLIRSTAHEEPAGSREKSVSSSVMKRIYDDESWRIPAPDRLHLFSFKLRRNLTAVISLCIALFVFTFLFSIINEMNTDSIPLAQESNVFGRLGDPVVVAASGGESMNAHTMPTAVASLKGFNEPFMYRVGPIQTVKDYMLFVSLLGLTCTLLIMNWLTRTRS